jgi:hypothetical protein
MSACDTYNTFLSSSAMFTGWKSEKDTMLNGITIETNATTATLTEAISNVTGMINCLYTKMTPLDTAANQITQLQTEILEKQRHIKNAEADIQIAKDRVAYIRNPDANTSYYESWFPIDRPMRPGSIAVLLALTLIMGIMIVLIIASKAGATVAINLAISPYGTPSLLSRLRGQMTPAFWVMTTALIAVSVVLAMRK